MAARGAPRVLGSREPFPIPTEKQLLAAVSCAPQAGTARGRLLQDVPHQMGTKVAFLVGTAECCGIGSPG